MGEIVFRKLKKACTVFCMLILYCICSSGPISNIFLKILLIMFFSYLIYWVNRNKRDLRKGKLVLLCLLVVSVVCGGFSNNVCINLISWGCMIFSSMFYLYSMCVEDSWSLTYVVSFCECAIWFPFAYTYDYLKKEQYNKIERIKRQKRINGVILSLTFTAGILIPAYMAEGGMFRQWIELVGSVIMDNLLQAVIAVVFGWIPAMLVYSYVRGIDKISEKTDRQIKLFSQFDRYKMFFDTWNIKLFFIINTVMNVVYAIAQIISFFSGMYIKEMPEDTKYLVPIMVAVILNVLITFLLVLIIKEKKLNENTEFISSYNIYYAISIVFVALTLGWRYFNNVFYYGMKGMWNIIGLVILFVLAFIVWNIVSICNGYTNLCKLVSVGSIMLLIIFNLCIPELIIGGINVAMFNYKYNNNLLNNSVENISEAVITQQDIDINYLRELGMWGIPSLLALVNIDNSYEEENRPLNLVVEDEIINILLNEVDGEQGRKIENMESGERLNSLIEVLEKNPAYQIPGYRKIILEKIKQQYRSE